MKDNPRQLLFDFTNVRGGHSLFFKLPHKWPVTNRDVNVLFFCDRTFCFFPPSQKNFVLFRFCLKYQKTTFLCILISNWLQSMVVRLDISYTKFFVKHLLLFRSDPHLILNNYFRLVSIFFFGNHLLLFYKQLLSFR